jgi:lysyl-tRNA synthetase class 2
VSELGAGGRSRRRRGHFERGFGKASFLRVRDRQGEMQLFCKSDSLGEGLARLEEIEVADFVEAEGVPMVTQKGELSVEPTSIRLLTKALRPLPEKWHGLTDVELRYRHRYVDLVANPEVKEIFAARSIIVRELRRYLDDLGFLEVETPTMHTLIGGAAAKPFVTHHNTLDMRLYMRIAPELYLKRLVVGGVERVYEMARCYRNEGISTRHNPEFTMLEAYRAYATYETLMDMTEDMLRTVDARLAAAMPEAFARWTSARPFSLDEPFARVPMKTAVVRALEKAGLPSDVPQEIRKGTSRIKEWAAKSPRSIGGAISPRRWRSRPPKEALLYAHRGVLRGGLPHRRARAFRSHVDYLRSVPARTAGLADPNGRPVRLFVDGREICNAFFGLNDRSSG